MADQDTDVENGTQQGEGRNLRARALSWIRRVLPNCTADYESSISIDSTSTDGWSPDPTRPPSISGQAPPGGFTTLTPSEGIRSILHQNCRATVLVASDDEITVNLASLQRIKILHFRQRLIHAAYDYRYAKRSILDDSNFPGVPIAGETGTGGDTPAGDVTDGDTTAEDGADDDVNDDDLTDGDNTTEDVADGDDGIGNAGGGNITAGNAMGGGITDNDVIPGDTAAGDITGDATIVTIPVENAAETVEAENTANENADAGDADAGETPGNQPNNPVLLPWDPPLPVDPTRNDDLLGDNDDILKEYTQAIRDWQFMKECWSWGPEEDPFTLSTRRQPDRDMIKSCFDSFEQEVGSPPREGFNDFLFDDYRHRPSFPAASPDWRAFSARGRGAETRALGWKLRLELLGMAVLGGSFLIVPMLIMVFINTLTWSLVTTSVSVLGFGVLLAFKLDKQFDVLSGTAAYAAVLVVFVGITLEGQTAQAGPS